MQITLESLEAKLLEENLKKMFRQAYEQGLADAQKKESLPYHLTKKHLAELCQVSLATVENIIRMDGFPKSTVAQARYPRDAVLQWMNENIEVVNYNHKKII